MREELKELTKLVETVENDEHLCQLFDVVKEKYRDDLFDTILEWYSIDNLLSIKRFHLLNVLIWHLKNRYSSFDQPIERNELERIMEKFLKKDGGIFLNEESFLQNKISYLIATAFIISSNHYFIDVLKYIISISELSESHCDLFVSIFISLDTYYISSTAIHQQTECDRKHYLDFRDSMRTVAKEFVGQLKKIISQVDNEIIIKKILNIFGMYSSWMEMDLFLNNELVEIYKKLFCSKFIYKKEISQLMVRFIQKGLPLDSQLKLLIFFREEFIEKVNFFKHKSKYESYQIHLLNGIVEVIVKIFEGSTTKNVELNNRTFEELLYYIPSFSTLLNRQNDENNDEDDNEEINESFQIILMLTRLQKPSIINYFGEKERFISFQKYLLFLLFNLIHQWPPSIGLLCEIEKGAIDPKCKLNDFDDKDLLNGNQLSLTIQRQILLSLNKFQNILSSHIIQLIQSLLQWFVACNNCTRNGENKKTKSIILPHCQEQIERFSNNLPINFEISSNDQVTINDNDITFFLVIVYRSYDILGKRLEKSMDESFLKGMKLFHKQNLENNHRLIYYVVAMSKFVDMFKKYPDFLNHYLQLLFELLKNAQNNTIVDARNNYGSHDNQLNGISSQKKESVSICINILSKFTSALGSTLSEQFLLITENLVYYMNVTDIPMKLDWEDQLTLYDSVVRLLQLNETVESKLFYERLLDTTVQTIISKLRCYEFERRNKNHKEVSKLFVHLLRILRRLSKKFPTVKKLDRDLMDETSENQFKLIFQYFIENENIANCISIIEELYKLFQRFIMALSPETLADFCVILMKKLLGKLEEISTNCHFSYLSPFLILLRNITGKTSMKYNVNHLNTSNGTSSGTINDSNKSSSSSSTQSSVNQQLSNDLSSIQNVLIEQIIIPTLERSFKSIEIYSKENQCNIITYCDCGMEEDPEEIFQKFILLIQQFLSVILIHPQYRLVFYAYSSDLLLSLLQLLTNGITSYEQGEIQKISFNLLRLIISDCAGEKVKFVSQIKDKIQETIIPLMLLTPLNSAFAPTNQNYRSILEDLSFIIRLLTNQMKTNVLDYLNNFSSQFFVNIQPGMNEQLCILRTLVETIQLTPNNAQASNIMKEFYKYLKMKQTQN
ncbi:hypothetical protein SNEBB_009716 [Seison nebaliae]|nr:hypothetical protein SNEBB_009716 [Seison nebaliae]